MKIISFSATEILPRLLDKSKSQTIRPYSKPRFKIGEKVKLMWKQRSKYKEWVYCYDCKELVPIIDIDIEKDDVGIVLICPVCISEKVNHFRKLLGIGEITEIFLIELWKHPDGHVSVIDLTNYKKLNYLEKNELAFQDGFRCDFDKRLSEFKVMANWFDEKYDISNPKLFLVYRWKWL